MRAPITLDEAWAVIADHYGWTAEQLAQAAQPSQAPETWTDDGGWEFPIAQPAHAHAIDTSPERVKKQAGNVQVSGWQPTDAAMAALRRFEETCADGEGYDVPKDTMKQLALIGLVAHLSGGRYVITDFGQSMLSAAPSTKEGQP